MILLLTTLITVYLYFACYFNLIPAYIFIVCSHVICMCTFSFILHTHWVAFWRPWICMSRYWMLSFITVLFMFYRGISYMLLLHAHWFYARAHFPLFYTLIGSLSDDPRFVCLNIGCFILLFRCSMRPYMLRGAGVSLYLFWYSCLPFYSCFYSFLDSIYIRLIACFIPLFIWDHV